MIDILYLIIGIAGILWGADRLTDGASALARRFRVSELVIGLTVVAFGTSLPEFVISFVSALRGSSELSMGNIIGSNIFNTLTIVGVSALFCPIAVGRSVVRKDMPFALLASLVLAAMSFDTFLSGTGEDVITRGEGLVLLAFFTIFMGYTFSIARNGGEQEDTQEQIAVVSYARIVICLLTGLAALVIGGRLFVDGATGIALAMGVSETIVGLTIVAAGTSLPELATSVVAARKGSSALAVGNVIGSNVFNIFWVVGCSAVAAPLDAGVVSAADFALMVFGLLLLWLFSSTKFTVERWEGGVLVSAYLLYMAWLVAKA
ncbi:MAG: calcium/sodium antiporter [Paraprevotella sp.]|nr:calcium/sodium antiporter [Paraprevotella sp.]